MIILAKTKAFNSHKYYSDASLSSGRSIYLEKQTEKTVKMKKCLYQIWQMWGPTAKSDLCLFPGCVNATMLNIRQPR